MPKASLSRNQLNLVLFVIGILVFRLVLLGAIPLLDKTEARYSEIARLMFETGEWAVLQIDYGVPFWAKPPLSTWTSAMTYYLFGINEFAARIPYFLMNLLLIIIIGKYVIKDKIQAIVFAFILLTIPEFLLHSGVVSTDTALCFSVSLIMISFWNRMHGGHRIWGYLFFVGVGLGLLAKGPIVIVLSGPPIFLWLVLQKNRWKDLFTKIPWIIGLLVTALIAIPWYYLAEQRSPGFFDYFIVGEHFKRFTEPEWSGDLYGGPKAQIKGMIWVFLLIFAFPWVQIVFFKLIQVRKTILKNPWVLFLVFWMLWIPTFFTISSNILHTYILPSTVPIALLMLHFWKDIKIEKRLIYAGAFFPVAAFVVFLGFRFTDRWKFEMNTDKYLLESVENSEASIVFWKRISYSSEFYTKGKAELIESQEQLDSVIDSYNSFYILIENKKKKEFSETFLNSLKELDSNKKRTIYSN